MKKIILTVFLLSGLAHGKVVQEFTMTIGYHSKESLSLRHYKTPSQAEGYALVKVLDNGRARFQRLSSRQHNKRQQAMLRMNKELKKFEVSPVSNCLEKISVVQAQGKGSRSASIFCLDQAPKGLKRKVVGLWRTGNFN